MNNIDLIRSLFQTHFWSAALTVLLVFAPIALWIWIFTKNEQQAYKVLAITFAAGIGSAVIMFLYQYYWETKLDFGFFELTPVNFQQNIGSWAKSRLASIFLVTLSIGVIEEYLKHWVVKKANHSYFTRVNDVIQLSIVAALGFAFTENIIYLFREFSQGGFTGKFFSLFILRSIFVVFVHVLCSGIYGYFYGVGFYAGPMLEEQEKDGKKERIPEFLHRLIHWKKDRVFQDEMITLGFLISITVHGLFDFFMSVDWTLGQLLHIHALDKIGLHIIVLPLYLIGGLYYLWHVLEKKEGHVEFGKRMLKEVYIGEREVMKSLKVLENVEKSIEKKFETKQKESMEKNFTANVTLLEKVEKTLAKKYQKKSEENTAKKSSPEEVMKNLEMMEKMEETIKKHYGKNN